MIHIERAGRPDRLSAEHRVVSGVRVVTLRGEIDHAVQEVLSQPWWVKTQRCRCGWWRISAG